MKYLEKILCCISMLIYSNISVNQKVVNITNSVQLSRFKISNLYKKKGNRKRRKLWRNKYAKYEKNRRAVSACGKTRITSVEDYFSK